MNTFEQEWANYFKNRGDVATVNIKELAKHFFELGLKTQKGGEGMNYNKSNHNLSFSTTFNMTDDWRKFFDEQLKEMQDEQKRVVDMLLKKIDEFLSKHTTFKVNPNKRNDDKLLDTVAFIARGCAIIGWNECFNYHFEMPKAIENYEKKRTN